MAYIRVGLHSDIWAYNWGWGLIMRRQFTVFAHVSLIINPLNPNIKTEILIYFRYTFSLEVVRRIC